jgi:O-antigen ligase
MIFRALISLYLVLVIANLEALTGAANTNPIEKGALLVCALVFVATRKINLTNIGLVLVIVLATLVSAAGTQHPGFGFDRYLRGLVSLVTPFLLLCAEPTRRDSERLTIILAFGPLAVMLTGALYQIGGIHSLWYTDFLTATRLQGSLSPAGLGSVCYVGAIAATLRAALAPHQTYRWLGLAAVNTAILVLSAARMPLALTALVCVTIYLSMINPHVTGIVAAIMAGIPVAATILLLFGGALLARFESQSLSGRDLIWQYLEAALAEHPVFGVGIGHQILLLPERVMTLTATMAAHNEYLRVAVETGYPGAVLIFCATALICLNIWRSTRVGRHVAFLAICVSFFIYCATDNALSSGVTPLALVLASFAFPRRQQTGTRAVRHAAGSARPTKLPAQPTH